MGDLLDFKTKDGRLVLIDLDEWERRITVWSSPERELIGHFCWRDCEDDNGGETYLKITHMYLEGPFAARSYIRQGIGTACLRALHDKGHTIVFSADDGVKHDDGSQLTGDGPVFAARMVAMGLAVQES
jgi:hypothetical protein